MAEKLVLITDHPRPTVAGEAGILRGVGARTLDARTGSEE